MFNQREKEPTTLKKIIKPNDIWYLNKLTNYPYISDRFNFAMYYYSKSGNKVISTLLENTLEFNNTDGVLNDNGKNILGSIINNKFGKKWLDLYNLYSKEYQFDKPYNITYSENSTDTLDSTENSFSNRVVKDKNTDETLKSTETNNSSRYGFNSDNPVPTDINENNFVDKSENNYDSNDTNERDNHYTRTNPKSVDSIKQGNIGNITIQELVNQEKEKLQYQIWDTICEDLDSVLTRSKYIY